ncbi:hypothetical protein [Paenibacillus harenae]|uniref:Uncharacterized protein n=1 Tax=Paenibacillus harenae TaxID=306543 RepID=A0ABT9U7Y5_PAEHA|nr:hypothetical protein [Paenibacillus harenae]MDQ0115770.1 hypothetical protein [Paenibacillus harenae]
MSKRNIPSRQGKGELDELDQELKMLLDDYSVEYPSEDAIVRTIDTLRPYVMHPDRRQTNRTPLPLKRDLFTILHIRPGFWLVNALIFLAGLYIWGYKNGDPYIILMLLAPVPFLIGLLEIFRGRDEGLMEMEMSCKYSAQQLLLAKMVVIGGYNVLLSTLLIAAFGLFGEPIVLTKLLMYWITPFTVVSSIGFGVACRMRGALSTPIMLTLWLFGIALFLSSDELLNVMNELHPSLYAALSALAIAVFAWQTKRFRRGEYFETIH